MTGSTMIGRAPSRRSRSDILQSLRTALPLLGCLLIVLTSAAHLLHLTFSSRLKSAVTLKEISSATLHSRDNPLNRVRTAPPVYVDQSTLVKHEIILTEAQQRHQHSLNRLQRRHDAIAQRINEMRHPIVHAQQHHAIQHRTQSTIRFAAESALSKANGGSGLVGRAPLPLCSRLQDFSTSKSQQQYQSRVSNQTVQLPGARTFREAISQIRNRQQAALVSLLKTVPKPTAKAKTTEFVALHRPVSAQSFYLFKRRRSMRFDDPTALKHNDAFYVLITMPSQPVSTSDDSDVEIPFAPLKQRVVLELCGSNIDDVRLHTELRIWNKEIVFNTKRDSGEWTSDFEVRKNVTAYAAQLLFAPGARFVIRLAVIPKSKFYRIDLMQSTVLNISSPSIDISTLEIVGSDQYTYSFRHDDPLVELARIHHVVVHATVPVSYDLIPHSGSFRMVNDVHSELSTFSLEPSPAPDVIYHNMQLITTSIKHSRFLLVGVLSHAANALNRWAIRRTWMNSTVFQQQKALVRFFVLPSGDPTVSPDAEHGELQKEADLFGDIVIQNSNFHEGRTSATLAMFQFAANIHVEYVLHVDDASLVRVDEIFARLDHLPVSGLFLGSFEPHRRSIPLVPQHPAFIVSKNLIQSVLERHRKHQLHVKVFDPHVSVSHWIESIVNGDTVRTSAEYCHEPRFHAGVLGDCQRSAWIVKLNGRPADRMLRVWQRIQQRVTDDELSDAPECA